MKGRKIKMSKEFFSFWTSFVLCASLSVAYFTELNYYSIVIEWDGIGTKEQNANGISNAM